MQDQWCTEPTLMDSDYVAWVWKGGGDAKQNGMMELLMYANCMNIQLIQEAGI